MTWPCHYLQAASACSLSHDRLGTVGYVAPEVVDSSSGAAVVAASCMDARACLHTFI